MLNNLVKKYQGKVNVVMRYTPLHQGSAQYSLSTASVGIFYQPHQKTFLLRRLGLADL
ncbi:MULTISPECIES: hypothetical protein [Colwellia]|uniref:hypothetical protein n=1 Tax=Colwellia TaxID=28228 RepID=UPI000B107624|nr:hypothetical protein [Colwellia marinimaniae]